jgi:hypothetical protein
MTEHLDIALEQQVEQETPRRMRERLEDLIFVYHGRYDM